MNCDCNGDGDCLCWFWILAWISLIFFRLFVLMGLKNKAWKLNISLNLLKNGVKSNHKYILNQYSFNESNLNARLHKMTVLILCLLSKTKNHLYYPIFTNFPRRHEYRHWEKPFPKGDEDEERSKTPYRPYSNQKRNNGYNSHNSSNRN